MMRAASFKYINHYLHPPGETGASLTEGFDAGLVQTPLILGDTKGWKNKFKKMFVLLKEVQIVKCIEWVNICG